MPRGRADQLSVALVFLRAVPSSRSTVTRPHLGACLCTRNVQSTKDKLARLKSLCAPSGTKGRGWLDPLARGLEVPLEGTFVQRVNAVWSKVCVVSTGDRSETAMLAVQAGQLFLMGV